MAVGPTGISRSQLLFRNFSGDLEEVDDDAIQGQFQEQFGLDFEAADRWQSAFSSTTEINNLIQSGSLSKAELISLCDDYPDYTTLFLERAHCGNVDEEVLGRLLTTSENLRKLSLEATPPLSAIGLTSSAEPIQNLQALNLKGASLFEGGGLSRFLKGFKSLRTLRLEDDLRNNAIESAIKNNPNLESLTLVGRADFRCSGGRPHFDDQALRLVAKHCKNLARLHIDVPETAIEYATLKNLKQLFSKLEDLKLFSKTILNEQMIDFIVRSLPPDCQIALGPCSSKDLVAISESHPQVVILSHRLG